MGIAPLLDIDPQLMALHTLHGEIKPGCSMGTSGVEPESVVFVNKMAHVVLRACFWISRDFVGKFLLSERVGALREAAGRLFGSPRHPSDCGDMAQSWSTRTPSHRWTSTTSK